MTMRSDEDLDLDVAFDAGLLREMNELERAAARCREDARSLRLVARSWREHPMAGMPGEAERFVEMNEAKAASRSRGEGVALAGLNECLVRSGSNPGDEWNINDSLYRVVTAGNPCVRLGCTLPKDESDTDPDWSDRDEQNTRMFEYAQMVRVGQP